MEATLLVHIAAGALGLASGFVALYTVKGASLHRKAGRVFVYTMLTMCAGGVLISAVRGVAPTINIPAGVLTAGLVITGVTTVRPPSAVFHWLNLGAMVSLLSVGAISILLGFRLLVVGGAMSGMAYPLFMFGLVGLSAGTGDVRVMRSGGIRGAARVRRHLWRMSFALFVASLSFFVGQAKVFPDSVRGTGVLVVPVITVLATMVYWLWRVRGGRAARVVAAAIAPEAV